MLTKRVISAIVGIIILIAVVFGGDIFIRIGVTILSMVALYELFSVTGIRKEKGLAFIGYLGALFIAVKGLIDSDKIILFFYGYVILLAVYLLMNHKKVTVQHIAIVFFAQIYICYFFFHIVLTNALPYGNIFIWLIFLGAWTTDTFAYFTGMLLGKTHPWPYISPKKTLEGSIGGVVGCGLSFLLYGYMLQAFGGYTIHYTILFLLGLLCSIISQIGDLTASVIKRQYNVKDYGYIMPGHGGVLDRFDSIIFVAPLVYYFVKYLNIII